MIPIPGFPDIPDWIQDQLGNLPDFVNPFNWFAEALKAVYALLVWFFEYIITNPPRVEADEVSDYLYGNAIGLTGLVVVAVTTVLLCISVVRVQRFFSAIEAIVIGVLVMAAAPFIIGLADTAINLGDELAKAMMFYDGSKDELLSIDIGGASNPLLMIAAFFPTSFLGLGVLLVVFSYELLIILLKLMVLPTLALRPLGPRAKALSDWVFSAALVVMVVGRPVMILCIELGQWAGDNIAGGTAAGGVFFLCASLVLAMVMQVVLYKQAQKVVAQVSGTTVSKVFGKVETTQKTPAKVDVGGVNARHADTFRAHDVPVTSGQPRPARAYVKHETRRAVFNTVHTTLQARAKTAATAAAAAGTGGTSAVVMGVAATAAGSAAKRSEMRRDKP